MSRNAPGRPRRQYTITATALSIKLSTEKWPEQPDPNFLLGLELLPSQLLLHDLPELLLRPLPPALRHSAILCCRRTTS
jgi:hypothetical protein